MRERGVHNQDASADDIAEMRRLLAESIAAGAVGFSTSRTIFHRSIGGEAVPGTYASDVELTELIHGMVIARQLEATEAELMHSVFPHPTLSEAVHESTLDAWGRALNH